MLGDRWYRFAPLSGIVFIVLFSAGAAVFPIPAVDASGESIRQDFIADRSMAFTAAILAASGVAFLLAFVGMLSMELRQEEGDAARLSPVVAGAGFAVAILMLAGLALESALAFDAESLTAGEARLLYTLFIEFMAMGAIPLTLFILGASIGFARTKSFDAWLAWAGVLAGIVAFTGVTQLYARDGFWSFTGAWGYICAIVPALWLALVGVAMAFPRVAHHHLPMAGTVARA